MVSKGYAKIGDFQNKLKPWSKEGVAASRKMMKAAAGGGGRGGKTVATQERASLYPMLCAILVLLVAVLVMDKVHGTFDTLYKNM